MTRIQVKTSVKWVCYLLFLAVGTQGPPVVAKSVTQSHISAADWGSLWVTRWSDAPSVQGRQRRLPPRMLDEYLAAGSEHMEEQLGGDKTIYVARYFTGQEANATQLLQHLGIITPIRGCCEGRGHLLVYMTRSAKEEASKRWDVFELIDALPPQLKVEPAGLGKLLEGIDGDESVPTDSEAHPTPLPPAQPPNHSPGAIQAVGVRVVLAEGAVLEPADMQRYTGTIAALLPSVADLEVVAQGLRAMLVRPLPLVKAYALAKHAPLLPFVLWVEPYPLLTTHNHFAGPVIQGSAPFSSVPLVFAAGLRGRNQTISVADTGLDVQHCFFRDDTQPVPSSVVNRAHRKVIKYVALGDAADVAGGHGTHVCGTVAGAAASGSTGSASASFQGIASAAKLAVYDIGGSSDNGSLAGLDSAVLSTILGDARNSGAAIHLNAWGVRLSSLQMSTSFNQHDVDDFLFRNEGVLLVQSGGNDGGHNLLAGNFTISSPGISKNALTVGASVSQAGSFDKCKTDCSAQQQESASCPGCDAYPDPSSRSELQGDAGEYTAYVAPFSSKGPTLDARIKPDLVAPGYRVWSANALSGDRCSLLAAQGTSSAAAVAAGAAAVIREYFMSGFYPTGVAVVENALTPSGALLKACLIHSGQAMRGYLRPRLHPLSGAVIHLEVHKFADEGVPFPNVYEGFGLLRLDRVLRLTGGAADSGPTHLWVRSGTSDGAVLLEGASHIYKFRVFGIEPLRVTLVWMDPASAIGSLQSTVNNLDLSVLAPDNATLLYPNGLQQPDYANNVERLEVAYPEVEKEYTVTVAATSVFGHAGQPYALVVTGNMGPVGNPAVGDANRQPFVPATCFFLDPVCVNGMCELVAPERCPRLAGGVRSASGGGRRPKIGDGDGIYGGGLGVTGAAAKVSWNVPLVLAAAFCASFLLF
eukprot:jgi/Mesen1/9268/ME000060S08707